MVERSQSTIRYASGNACNDYIMTIDFSLINNTPDCNGLTNTLQDDRALMLPGSLRRSSRALFYTNTYSIIIE